MAGDQGQMKITIESTTKVVNANGIECRVWEGTTERGVKIEVLIPRIAALANQDLSQFEAELKETHAPPSIGAHAFPARLIL
jgi:hypothetical protein